MKMHLTPAPIVGAFESWARWTRRAGAIIFAAASLISSAQAQTYAVSTLAGSSAGFSLTVPSGAVVDGSGNIYITDALNNAVKKITSAGVVSTLVNSGLSSPQGIAIDGSGNLYVADSGNGAVKKIVVSGPTVSTLATGLTTPYGIAVDSAGATVYVADAGTSLIKKIVVAGPTVTTLAGGGSDSPSSTSTVLTSAQFALPSGLALNAAGTILYVADTNNNLVRKIDISGATVAVLAGSSSGYTEGTGSAAQFKSPRGIALFGSNLVVSDTLNQVIRLVTTGGTTSLFAGVANSQGSTDGLALGVATFKNPTGVTADSTNVYVVDTTNQSLRKIAQASAPAIGGGGQPTSQVVTSGNTATFTVGSVSGNPPVTYQWQVSTDTGTTWNNINNGAITGGTVSGATTASLSIASVTSALNANQYRVVISNGVTPNATSSAALLTVRQVPAITNSSTTFNATVNSAISGAQITASGSPAPTFAVTSGASALASAGFSLNTTSGVISGTPTSNGTINFTVAATNTAGTSSGVAFTISVVSGPSIGTQPSGASVAAGNNQTFTVGANANGGTLSYQWQVSTDSGATWNNISDGSPTNYTGTATATLTVNGALVSQSGYQFRVVVTSTVGSPATVTSNAVALTVTQAPSFTSLASTTFITGQSNSFSVTATGSPAPTFSIVSGTLPSSVGTLTNFGSGTATISGSPATSDASGSPYSFTLQATSSAGTVTQSFSLVVGTATASPTITTQPTSQTVQVAANATFTAAATGNPTPTVQWQRQPAGTSGFVSLSNDSTYSGTTTGTLTITSVQAGMTGDQFQLVATNSNGSVTSSAVTLTVNIGAAFTTFAGTAGQYGTADGTGLAARFNAPSAIAYDASSGSFYVADSSNHVIRKINATGVVTTFAGTAGSNGSVDGTGAAARFSGPSAVTVDSVGNVYVADTYNQTIRAISPAGVVTTVAGLANNGGFIDGTGSAARFSLPSGIVADNGGNLYVADTSNHNIRKVTIGGVVTTLAGGYAGSLSTGAVGLTGLANGNGASARFNYPVGIARDTNGNLYVADSYNHAIRKIDTSANVTTLAGSVGSAGSTDANGTSAKFNQPLGVAVDSSGVVYVADTYNDTIRKIDTSLNVTTLAGSAGQTGSTDGIGSAVRFYQPFGITLDGNSNLYIVDTRNFTIRRSGTTTAPGITTQPANQSGVIGGSAIFTVVATGVPAPSYQWQRQAATTSGFTNLVNDSVNYSGVTTATLTVSNLTSLNDGDQYRVILSNGISPSATSNAATFTIVTAPAFTSASGATFNVGQQNAFAVTTSSSATVSYSATGLPSWLSLNSTTGILSGTPPDASGSPLSLVITASNGGVTTQNFSLTLAVPQVAPSITTQPVGATLNPGDNAVFSVTATGTAPLSYQWSKNGVPIFGATSSTFSLASAQPSNAGSYTVVVANLVSSVISNAATLAINAAPTISAQPRSQTVAAGSSVTFFVTASSSPAPTYQWRFNGVPIAGAGSSTYTVGAVQSGNAGNYDVIVGNLFGQQLSSTAQLVVASSSAVPLITLQPVSRTVPVGTATTLTVVASGVPAPTYQWRKNGSPIGGATSTSYAFGSAQTGDAGNYDVVVSNSAGSVTSSTASLGVIRRSFAGIYFGSFGGTLGSFALYIRPDNTGVFLGYLPGSNLPVKNLGFSISDTGVFSFTQATSGAISTSSIDGEARAAAVGDISFSGAIDSGGSLTGTVTGVAGASLAASKTVDNGGTQAVAGFYAASAVNSSATLYSIAGSTGIAFVLTQNSTTSDGGVASVDAGGRIVVATSKQIISLNVNPTASTLTGTAVAGSTSTAFAGGSEAVIAAQRLGNISTRANVGTGNNVAIAGFVISGTESKPVLIRAIGPTLSLFGIGSPLSNPKLELFNGSNVSVTSNTGWSTAPNTAAIVAASSQAGAFALSSTSADSVIFTTLAPGNYTAVVSSANGGQGVALIEVYDLSAPTAGQKLFNISTRANAGTGANTLAAGFVINGSVPKRVLIRGVGPGLVQFGFTNALGATQLQLISSSNQVLVQNTGWGTSADASAIALAASQVGAFPLVAGSADSAMIVSLAPGNYTAQINPVNSAGGVAIIEVYELP